jgi:hypothetical protein
MEVQRGRLPVRVTGGCSAQARMLQHCLNKQISASTTVGLLSARRRQSPTWVSCDDLALGGHQ